MNHPMDDDIVDLYTEGFPYEREARERREAEQRHTLLHHLLKNQEDAIQRLDLLKASLDQRTARLAALVAKGRHRP